MRSKTLDALDLFPPAEDSRAAKPWAAPATNPYGTRGHKAILGEYYHRMRRF